MAYSKEHSDLITDNWTAITSDVEMRHIVDLLIQKRVISPTDWDDMKKAHPLTKDQMQAFLIFLTKQPKSSFKKFIEALKESGKYNHIVKILQPTVSSHQYARQEPEYTMNQRNFRLLWEKVIHNEEGTQRKLDALTKEIEENKCDRRNKEEEIKMLLDKLQQKEEEMKKLQEKYQQKEAEYRELYQNFQRQTTEIINKTEETNNEKLNLKAVKQQLERLQAKHSQKDKDYSKLSLTLETKTRENTDLKEKLDKVDTQFQKAKLEIERLERDNIQKEEKNIFLNETSQRHKTELRTLNEETRDVKSNLNKAKQEILRLQRDNNQLSRCSTSVNEFTETTNLRRSNTFGSESKMVSPDPKASIKDEIKKENETSKTCCLQ